MISITIKNSVRITRGSGSRRPWRSSVRWNVTPASLARVLRLVEGCEGKVGRVATTYEIKN